MRQGVIHDTFRLHVPAESVEEQWDIRARSGAGGRTAPEATDRRMDQGRATAGRRRHPQAPAGCGRRRLRRQGALVGAEAWAGFERNVMLQSLDSHWREHLSALDHLRQGIHLRGYAQKNPKQEYKREAFELFEALLQTVRNEVTKLLMTVEVRSEEQIEEVEAPPQLENVQYHHADYDEALAATAEPKSAMPVERHTPKVGRNDPCPCGSGKKYKHCHGKLTTLVENGDAVIILDQTRLPREAVMLRLVTLEDAAHAIRVMQVRGAPLIGATAAYGVALGLANDGGDARLEHVLSTLAADPSDGGEPALGAGAHGTRAAKVGAGDTARDGLARGAGDRGRGQGGQCGHWQHGLPLIAAIRCCLRASTS
jgi:hypothetical protein